MPKIEKGQKAMWVAEETDYRILKALHTASVKALEGYRFSELLVNVKPRIARDTLARHLKTLYKKRLIGYDKLNKRYFITDKGWNWLKNYERLSLLKSGKWVYEGVPSTVEVTDVLVKMMVVRQVEALMRSMQKAVLAETFGKAFSWDIYSDLPIEVDEEFKRSFGAEAGKLVLGLVSRVREDARIRLNKMEKAKLLVVLEFDFKRYAEEQLKWLEHVGAGGGSGQAQ